MDPIVWYSPEFMTRSSPAWTFFGQLPISSRTSVPPLASPAFETPILRCREMLGDPEHATGRDLDRVVWKAFFETLETYPRTTTIEVLPSVFVQRFRGAARKAADAMEAHRRVRGAPPRDAGRVVLLVGEESSLGMAVRETG